MNSVVTVVICTYNRASVLKLALQSLVEQTAEKNSFKIIVVDNNSTDDTKKVVEDFKNKLSLKYVFEDKQGLSHARNRGYQEADTEYVAYLDDDAKADRNWVNIMSKIIQEEKVEVFGGPYHPYYLDEPPLWIKDSRLQQVDYGDSARILTENEYINGTNMVYRRGLLEKYNGFRTDLGMAGKAIAYGEETELQKRFRKDKMTIKVYPDLLVYHLVPEYKMKLGWYLKAAIGSRKSILKMTPLPMNWHARIHCRLIFIRKILAMSARLFFRDKKTYPYWQHFIIKKLSEAINYLYL
jgi:glucosyl-dolichyl phosphate glucuronosyltransferase